MSTLLRARAAIRPFTASTPNQAWQSLSACPPCYRDDEFDIETHAPMLKSALIMRPVGRARFLSASGDLNFR